MRGKKKNTRDNTKLSSLEKNVAALDYSISLLATVNCTTHGSPDTLTNPLSHGKII